MKRKAALLFASFLIFGSYLAAEKCHDFYSWLRISKDEAGYSVYFDEDILHRNPAPIGSSVVVSCQNGSGLFPDHIYLLRAHTLRPIDRDQVWFGESPIDAYRRFLADVGLEIRRAQKGGWVVGTKEQLENVGVLGYVFDWSSGKGQTYPENQWKMSLLFYYATRAFSTLSERGYPSSPSMSVFGVGLARLHEGHGSHLLTVSGRSENGFEGGYVQKVIIDQSDPQKIIPVWLGGDFGRFVPEFQFDLNLDGYRDLLFSSYRDNSDSFVLSGSDGTVMIQFRGGELIVGQPEDLTRSFVAADYLPLIDDEYGSFPGVLEVAGSDLRIHRSEFQKKHESGVERSERTTFGLLEALGVPADRVTMIRLPGMRAGWHPSEVTVVNPSEVEGWQCWNSILGLGNLFRSDLVCGDGIRVEIEYSPEKVTQWVREH